MKPTYQVVQIAPYSTGTMTHVLATGLGQRKAHNLAARLKRQAPESASTFHVRTDG